MKDNKGLFFAYLLDGKGGGKSINWSDIKNWTENDGILWIHLDYSIADSEKWLIEQSGLDELVATALINEDPRPRCTILKDGLLVMLRALNLNPGADPEDMVSIRLWVNENRIISTNKRNLLSVTDLCNAINEGNGPHTTGAFLSDIAERIVERMTDIVNELDDKVDYLEDQILNIQSYQFRSTISELRREAINLRRYLAPQREAMTRLYNERIAVLNDMDRMRLHEAADSTMRYIENLDTVREKAIVIQEELMSHLSEQMDKRIYVLSMVAAIFLPLGFLTGLLGINVGGIPGAENQSAFWFFCLILITIIVMQVLIFKKMKWM
ncbi:MAG: zinc transporter ZntB [Gammaproteobacteria bacterium]|nr:zinc transporter ZntB [Gammaproteobacteria bacterium]